MYYLSLKIQYYYYYLGPAFLSGQHILDWIFCWNHIFFNEIFVSIKFLRLAYFLPDNIFIWQTFVWYKKSFFYLNLCWGNVFADFNLYWPKLVLCQYFEFNKIWLNDNHNKHNLTAQLPLVVHFNKNNQYIRQAIDAKMCVERCAMSGAIGANMSVERYCSYNRDKDSNYYRIEQDAVVEVLTEGQKELTFFRDFKNLFWLDLRI